MNSGEYLSVKVFPSVGPVFYVLVPESVEDIDLFLDEHLTDVEFWETAEDGRWIS